MRKIVAEAIKEVCVKQREGLLEVEAKIRNLSKACFGPHDTPDELPLEADAKEAGAQAMLAVRDLEAARMRLGKVMQYLRDGVSSYDKPQLP